MSVTRSRSHIRGAPCFFQSPNLSEFDREAVEMLIEMLIALLDTAIQFSGFDANQCQRGLRLCGKLPTSGGDVTLACLTHQTNNGVP